MNYKVSWYLSLLVTVLLMANQTEAQADSQSVACDINRSDTWVFETTITTTDASITSCNMDNFFSEGIWWSEEQGSSLMEAEIAPTVTAGGVTWTCTEASRSELALEATCTSDSSIGSMTISGVNLENLGRPTACPCVTGPVPLYLKSELPNPLSCCDDQMIASGTNSIEVTKDYLKGSVGTLYGCRVEVAGGNEYKVEVLYGQMNKTQWDACNQYASDLIDYYEPGVDWGSCGVCNELR